MEIMHVGGAYADSGLATTQPTEGNVLVSTCPKNLIVIPALDEEHALPNTIAKLQDLPDDYELLVINDGSSDATGRVALELAKTSRLPLYVLNLAWNSGIGVAVQTGYLFALDKGGYEYVIQFDADGQHDAGCIQLLVEECRSRRLDMCVGSRFLANSGEFRSTFWRRQGIRFFSTLISVLTQMKITDPTSGFRCAGPRAWQSFANRYPDDYPEPESLYWCIRNKFRVAEVPVLMHQRKTGMSSIHSFQSLYYMCKVTLAILVDVLRAKEHHYGR